MEQDLDTPAGSEELGRAQALVKSGDWAGAEALLAGLVLGGTASAPARVLYFRVLLRQGKSEDAVRSARDASEAHPSDARVQALYGLTLLKLDRIEDACRHLDRATENFPEDASIWALQAEAQLKAGMQIEAWKSANKACALDIASVDYALLKIVVLAASGEDGKARQLMRDVTAHKAELAAQFHDIIVYWIRHGRHDDAMALAKNACALLPEAAGLRIFYAERLLAANRPPEARAVLDEPALVPETMKDDQALRFHKVRGRALQAMLLREDAIAEYDKVLALDPNDQDALRDLYVLHQKLGNTERMRSAGQRLAGAGAKTLPESLAAGLDALRTRRQALKNAAGKLAWAWEIADRTRWQYDDWLAAVEWGWQADQLLRAWWLKASERSDELEALIDRPARSAVELLADSPRALSVTTHMGPIAGCVHYLQTCGRPFRGFGFRGPDPVVGDAPPMRIASGDAAAALREMLAQIRQGTLVGFAQDTPDIGSESLRFDLFGRSVPISTLVPRLIHKHRAASLWCQPLWRGGRIVIELERLPDPQDGEPIDEWCRRWCEAYVARIAAVMRGAPENLVLGAGIWLNADTSFSERRRGRP